MIEPFALAAFLGHWLPRVDHDLASSDCEPLTLPALLGLAEADDLRLWETLGLGYLDPRGALRLRSAIAECHAALGPDDILCCAGAQEALGCVTAALLGTHDHAVVVLPIYQPSEEAVTARCAATGVVLREAEGWHLDIDRIAAAIRPDTKLVLMNFPNSPTGAVLDPEELGPLIALCRERGLWLVNDEVYRHTDPQGGGRPRVVDLYERGITIDGLSKGFGLAGLRVGWVACRDRTVLSACLEAKNRLSSCLSAASEVLARIAVRARIRILDRNQSIGIRNQASLRALIEGHPDILEADPSDNFAFAFPRLRGGDADGFAIALANEVGVLVLPSGLWRSQLASIPTDRLRIGLGRADAGRAFDAVDAYLSRRSMTKWAAE